jgi:hypothetical protein
MACFHPILGMRSRTMSANGKYPIVFDHREGYTDLPVEVPCGQCIGCRIDRSRSWAIRCVHESLMHERNCFITLTYDDVHLPEDGSVHLEDFQLFMKRLRKKYGCSIRFFHCGEYGEKLSRPHYHAILFGFDFEDKESFRRNKGSNYFISQSLASLWPFGFHVIADCNFSTIYYTTKYCLKKVVGKRADEHYQGRKPEYVTMSL